MNEANEVEVEEDSLNSALADAWDASEIDNGGEDTAEVQEPVTFDSGDAGGDTGETSDESTIRQGENDFSPVSAESEESSKPPVGLSLESREVWANVPDAVKADIVKREQDYEKGIVQYSQQAKRADAMDKSLQPFQQYFQMNGGAGQSIQGLLQTGSTLQMGTPTQKAQVVASIIKQFGVDIQSLDSMLVNEAPSAESQQQSQMEQMINQRLGPMQEQLQGYQQREQWEQQQAQGHVAQEVSNFGASNEFYNDVRGDMADLMDMAANRNREMGMQEAYNLACANHPQISKIMSGRSSQQSVNQKRQAASSISGSPGGGMQGQAANSVAAALNDAWDSAGRM
tara:strand:- start:7384 stop:8409 length:1026 start_codon:yes stop_codon:yes gene_type:complete